MLITADSISPCPTQSHQRRITHGGHALLDLTCVSGLRSENVAESCPSQLERYIFRRFLGGIDQLTLYSAPQISCVWRSFAWNPLRDSCVSIRDTVVSLRSGKTLALGT